MTSSEALLSDARHGDSRAWTPQLWAILFVLGGALCLDALDVSMIGVALPSIRSALDLSTSSLQWIVSGYVLGYGGLLFVRGPGAGRAGPPAGLPGRAGRLRSRLLARRPGQRSRAADSGPFREGSGGCVHRARQHVA